MTGPKLIDSDIHHDWTSDSELLEYLPKRYRDIILAPSGALSPLKPPATWPPHLTGSNSRTDTFPEGGGASGSDYETMKKQCLDPFNVQKAILSFNVGTHGALTNPYLGREIVRAANDWNREKWLRIDDDRIASVIMIPSQEPEESAKEIRRVAGHPKLVEILLIANPLGRPFGHPIYHTIYEAAAEVGLPIGIHVGGEVGMPFALAGGVPNSRLEFHTLHTQAMHHHLLSMITHGVFEKFPKLHALFIEIGVTWAPWLIWNMDAMYTTLKKESPWVKKLPSEYFRQHIRITTQPLELSPKPANMIDLLSSIEGIEDILCFASDYPHWDTDDPRFIVNRFPQEWRAKIFYNNAAKMYGWPELPEEEILGKRRRRSTSAEGAAV